MEAVSFSQVVSEDRLDVVLQPLAHYLTTASIEIGLNGSLGAGKTRLVKTLLSHHGYKHDHVTSPSFALCHEYKLSLNDKIIEHWDLYRLSEIPEELYSPPENKVIRLIEWVELFPELYSRAQLNIHISMHDSVADSREYRFDLTNNSTNAELVAVLSRICTY